MVIKAFVQQLKYLSFHNYHLADLAEKGKSVQQEITTKTCQSIAVLHYQFSLVCPAPRLHHKSSHHKPQELQQCHATTAAAAAAAAVAAAVPQLVMQNRKCKAAVSINN